MIRPITPRETPKPIPTFAPVDRSLDGVDEDEGRGVEDVVDEVGPVLGTNADEEVVDDVVPEVVEAEADVVVEVAPTRLTFHPTTPIAPTVEALGKVVVTIDH